MKEILQENALFVFLDSHGLQLAIVLLIVGFASVVIGNIIAAKKNAKDRPGVIFACLTVGILSLTIGAGTILAPDMYMERVLEPVYKEQLEAHIAHLKETNDIEDIRYAYVYGKLSGEGAESHISIRIKLNRHDQELNLEDASLDEAIKADIQYKVKSEYTIMASDEK